MQRVMEDARARTQLLRFVDVFPALRTARSISEHFLEYVTHDAAVRLPAPLRLAERFMERFAIARPLSGHAAAIAIRQMAYFALTYDHRIVDGADAERFLSYMKEFLEKGEFSL